MLFAGTWITTFHSLLPSDGNSSRLVSGIYRTEEAYTKMIMALYVALAEHNKPGSFHTQTNSQSQLTAHSGAEIQRRGQTAELLLPTRKVLVSNFGPKT
jgi:hypothetical protein